MDLSIGEYKLPLGYTAVVEDGKIVIIEKQNYKPNPGDLLYIEYNDWCDDEQKMLAIFVRERSDGSCIIKAQLHLESGKLEANPNIECTLLDYKNKSRFANNDERMLYSNKLHENKLRLNTKNLLILPEWQKGCFLTSYDGNTTVVVKRVADGGVVAIVGYDKKNDVVLNAYVGELYYFRQSTEEESLSLLQDLADYKIIYDNSTKSIRRLPLFELGQIVEHTNSNKTYIVVGYDRNSNTFIGYNPHSGYAKSLKYDNCYILSSYHVLTEIFKSSLKVNGVCWNPDTKKIERIIWTPKSGEEFYYIDMYFGLIKRTNYDTSDVVTRLIEAGNCFKDEKEAESVLDRIKNVFEQRRAL
jgi:hypothetical protein